MGWKLFLNDGTVDGTRASGDPTVSATKWYNHLYLLLFVWKKVTVFQVLPEVADRGYRIGYIPEKGKPMTKSEILYDLRFRVRNGREDCVFFALSTDDKGRWRETPLELLTQTTKDDPAYTNIPLY